MKTILPIKNYNAFKKLTSDNKYKIIIKFCDSNKRLPSYKGITILERKMHRFFVNKRSSLDKRENTTEAERDLVKQIEGFQESITEKLKAILEFSKKHKHLPRYKSLNIDESSLGRKFTAVKYAYEKNQLPTKDRKLYKKILKHRSKHQKTRIEKLQELLKYCTTIERLPKQHVSNLKEKRFAEFLSSIKILKANDKLKPNELEVFTEILTYKKS